MYSYWAMPGFWLKRQILLNLPSDNLELNVANSVDFMVERVRIVVATVGVVIMTPLLSFVL